MTKEHEMRMLRFIHVHDKEAQVSNEPIRRIVKEVQTEHTGGRSERIRSICSKCTDNNVP